MYAQVSKRTLAFLRSIRPMPPFWYVYVLMSVTAGRTYVGVALDPYRRLLQHNGAQKGGAKSTRAGRPWTLATLYGPYSSRAEAQRIERRVKALRGPQRLSLLALQSEAAATHEPLG